MSVDEGAAIVTVESGIIFALVDSVMFEVSKVKSELETVCRKLATEVVGAHVDRLILLCCLMGWWDLLK